MRPATAQKLCTPWLRPNTILPRILHVTWAHKGARQLKFCVVLRLTTAKKQHPPESFSTTRTKMNLVLSCAPACENNAARRHPCFLCRICDRWISTAFPTLTSNSIFSQASKRSVTLFSAPRRRYCRCDHESANVIICPRARFTRNFPGFAPRWAKL